MTEQEFAALASWITNIGLEGGAEARSSKDLRPGGRGRAAARPRARVD
jgi:hypothetical protein